MENNIRVAYMIKFPDGMYLAPRQSAAYYQSQKTTFDKARIFSTRKSVDQASMQVRNSKVVEVYLTEAINLLETQLVYER